LPALGAVRWACRKGCGETAAKIGRGKVSVGVAWVVVAVAMVKWGGGFVEAAWMFVWSGGGM